jgi:hypothetical protein
MLIEKVWNELSEDLYAALAKNKNKASTEELIAGTLGFAIKLGIDLWGPTYMITKLHNLAAALKMKHNVP